MLDNYYNSKVTLELREILAGLDENGQPFKLWDFDYPSFYEGEKKLEFEQKVIDHYYFRQIGFETVGRFKHAFRTKIREIMPYYIRLYDSEKHLDVDDPFESYVLKEEFTESRSGRGKVTGSSSETSSSETSSEGSSENTGSTTGTTSGDLTRKLSDTPQGSIANLDDYMTEATVEDTSGNSSEDRSESSTNTASGSSSSTGSGSTEQNSEDTQENTYTLTRKGNIGVATLGEELTKLRSAFLNIDVMIINDLADLFLKVY